MITILFVDDEPALLDVSRLYLEKTGEIKVDTCYSAEQALELPRGRVYDVIVSDYEMPGMNGISFLKTVRKLGIDTPFIIFTGRGKALVLAYAFPPCGKGSDDAREQMRSHKHVLADAIPGLYLEVSPR